MAGNDLTVCKTKKDQQGMSGWKDTEVCKEQKTIKEYCFKN